MNPKLFWMYHSHICSTTSRDLPLYMSLCSRSRSSHARAARTIFIIMSLNFTKKPGATHIPLSRRLLMTLREHHIAFPPIAKTKRLAA
jgi:hypothetical protein